MRTVLSADVQTRRRAVGINTQSVTQDGPFTMVLKRDKSAGDHNLQNATTGLALHCYPGPRRIVRHDGHVGTRWIKTNSIVCCACV